MSRKKKPEVWPRSDVPDSADARREREDKMLAVAGYRKISTEEYQSLLESKANAILAQADRDAIKAMAENVEVIRASFEQLKLPSNDPEYLARLQKVDDARNQISNQVESIHIVPDGGTTWLGVGLVNPKDHATARAVAEQMRDHFEAKLIAYEDQSDKTRSADCTQVREPAHAVGREKRSLPE